MNFVGGPALAGAFGGDLADDFFGGESGDDREQAEAAFFAGVAGEAERVAEAFAEHLVAAAEADDERAARGGGLDDAVEALGSEPAEVGDRVF